MKDGGIIAAIFANSVFIGRICMVYLLF